MIITKVLSGLGNQLFQYVIGRELAIKNDVELKLDISFFDIQSLRSFKLTRFDINAKIATTDEIDKFIGVYIKHDLFSKAYRKLEKMIPRTKRRLFKEETPWYFESNLCHVSDNTYIDGYWQHYKYFEDINPIIFKELVVKEKYSYAIQNIVTKIVNDQNSVSIHIRRGDYLTDKEAFHLMGVIPLSYYYLAIDHIKSKILNPKFYIFSDDMNWVKINLKIEEPCYYIDGGKDYIDLDLMSKCKHNIIANSSFSWWGAFLNKNLSKIVITPKQWVLPNEINSRIELAFPSWIKI